MSRREFGTVTGGAFGTLMFTGACTREGEGSGGSDGRITARPKVQVKTKGRGELALGLGASRDGVLRFPAKISDAPMPLLVVLHGAGGSGEGLLGYLGNAPDDAGVVVMAPDSRGSTWDAIRTEFGPDVAFLSRALERVFETVAVDPTRLAIGGFSDGVSYALSLGLMNGDLFRHVVALSPGFVVAGAPNGRPRCFVSHGKADDILPIDRCSRRIVPALEQRGHEVTYREFEGGHEVPPAILAEAMKWLIAK